MEAFVFLKVKAALQDFYRKEWAYACHCVSQTEGEEEGENGEFALLTQKESERQEWLRVLFHWALAKLSGRERFVTERLYCDGWTETEIAQALKISQQAVSKIKRQAIEKLRQFITWLEELLF
ncbi:MAG: sigma-70 family RNA polymerase sigma factor [Candidatus Fervidibacter sp.]|uniref:sigma-70 family RNA polymerase sigma factor n=1 Tax=Candidatus Fervidibacter sp. TaxID=3100871 RepID=UPI00404AC389